MVDLQQKIKRISAPFEALMKYGEMKPRSNFIPSIVSSSSCSVFPSLTVMTPLLPTLFIASEIRFPTSLSPLAEMVATWEEERTENRWTWL